MSEAIYIELPPTPGKRRSFFRSWRGAVLLLLLAAVLLAGCFSWWLSQGKVTSVYAQVDTVVFTVEPEFAARLDEVLVRTGQEVRQGEPLARINPDLSDAPRPAPQPSQDAAYTGRMVASSETEKRLSTQLDQARAEEERYRQMHHDRVIEHVRAQLYMRSVDRGNPMAYNEAGQMEAAARQRMDVAREQFERVSKARAAMEVELGRIRIELARKKRASRGAPEKPQPMPQDLPPQAPAQLATLYAPVAGRIMDVSAAQGQILHQGHPVFVILPAGGAPGDTWIQAWFPISARNMLKPGQKAQIKFGDLHVAGNVTGIATEAQSLSIPGSAWRQDQKQYLPVRIQVENAQDLAKLTPGAKVECQIQTRYVIGESMF